MLDGLPPDRRFNAQALATMAVPGCHANGIRGDGIAIGFIDYGFDWAHPAFQRADGFSSRFQSVWRQGDDGGRVFRPGTFGCNALGYDPHAGYFGPSGHADPRFGAHGTQMASIAGGSPHADFLGVAPNALLFGVHLDLPDTAWQDHTPCGTPAWDTWSCEPDRQWNGWQSYADARPVVEGIDFLIDEAQAHGARALVINLSIGTWAGGHDGQGLVTRKIDDVTVSGRQGRNLPCVVVVGAGNAGLDQGHVTGRIARGGEHTITWQFHERAAGTERLEIWWDDSPQEPGQTSFPADERTGPALTCHMSARRADSPNERLVFDVSSHRTTAIDCDGARLGLADLRPAAHGSRSRFRLSLAPGRFADRIAHESNGRFIWQVTLTHVDGSTSPKRTPSVSFHAWRERCDSPYRSRLAAANSTGTLCDFACADHAIVVGGHDVAADGNIAPFAHASRGPRPWARTLAERCRPHVSAAAVNVWGARSLRDDFVTSSGTSAATAFASGCTALVMQRALARGNSVAPDALVPAFLGHPPGSSIADLDPADWHPCLGFGPIQLSRQREIAT